MDDGGWNTNVKRTHLAVIGGFLGAGKTTTILALAKMLLAEGKKLGIVTNDQGSDLVDTQYLADQGLPVLEVSGGCFCCHFDEFTQKVEELAKEDMPDVILAEPVGSCTDLVATIFRPLQKQQRLFQICPLTVVADPRRVTKLMLREQSPFPNEINYLFERQLAEADVILLNRADIVAKPELERLAKYLEERFPGATVLQVSAKDGTGLAAWPGQVLLSAFAGRKLDEVDYQRYGRAEQQLGWMNAVGRLTAEQEFGVDDFLLALTERISGDMQYLGCQIAHLKLYAIGSGERHAKISVVDIEEQPDFALRFGGDAREIQLVVNARILIAPENLSIAVEAAIQQTAERFALKLESYQADCFAPGWPNPTHRVLE